MTVPTRKLKAIPLLMALLLTVGACGKAAEKATEKITEEAIEAQGGGDVDVNLEEGGYRVETEDGSAEFGTGMPEGWPDDIGLPEGFEPTGGANVSQGQETMITLAGTTPQDLDAVVAFFEEELGGWTEISRSDLAGDRRVVNLSYENGERALVMGAAESDTGSELTISYQVSPAA